MALGLTLDPFDSFDSDQGPNILNLLHLKSWPWGPTLESLDSLDSDQGPNLMHLMHLKVLGLGPYF